MSLSMFEITVPGFFGSFQAMNTWFAKAQAHADDCKLDSINDLGLRLAPDMLPLTKQVQIATDMAKGCVARLGAMTCRSGTTAQPLWTTCARARPSLTATCSWCRPS